MEVLKCEAELKMGNGHWEKKQKKALAQKTNCLPHTYAQGAETVSLVWCALGVHYPLIQIFCLDPFILLIYDSITKGHKVVW